MELADGNLFLVNVESIGGYVVAVRVIEGCLPPQLVLPSFFVHLFVTAAMIIVFSTMFHMVGQGESALSPIFSGAGQGRSPID